MCVHACMHLCVRMCLCLDAFCSQGLNDMNGRGVGGGNNVKDQFEVKQTYKSYQKYFSKILCDEYVHVCIYLRLIGHLNASYIMYARVLSSAVLLPVV